MLIAEDLLLLLTDDDSGKLVTSGAHVDVALGGALLAELALKGHVELTGPGEPVREGRLVVRDAGPAGDGVLDDALATVVQQEGRKPQSVVAGLGRGTRVRLYERLVAAGVLRAEEGRILGVYPTHRWPAEHTDHEAAVRAGLLTALRDGVPTDPRTPALVSLLFALNAVHKAVDPDSVGLSKRELTERAQRLADGNWAAKAVRSAITSRDAALIAATSPKGSFGGGGGA